MAGSLRLLSRSWLNVARPVTDASAVRSFSVATILLADKKSTKAKAPKPAAPPKPAAAPPKTAAAPPKTAAAPPKAAAASTTKGDTYEVPEFFAYNEMSYYALESDMRNSRLPQPKPGQPCD